MCISFKCQTLCIVLEAWEMQVTWPQFTVTRYVHVEFSLLIAQIQDIAQHCSCQYVYWGTKSCLNYHKVSWVDLVFKLLIMFYPMIWNHAAQHFSLRKEHRVLNTVVSCFNRRHHHLHEETVWTKLQRSEHTFSYFPIQLFMLSCSFFVLQNSVLWKLWRNSLTTKAIALLGRSLTVILFACRMVLQLVPFQRIFLLWWPFWCGVSGCEQWGVWVRSTTL